jgi:hypothetical protein
MTRSDGRRLYTKNEIKRKQLEGPRLFICSAARALDFSVVLPTNFVQMHKFHFNAYLDFLLSQKYDVCWS